MYSNKSRAADYNKSNRKLLNKDKTPKRSNRGPYLSLTTTNTLPNLSTGNDSVQTESGLLVVDQLQMPLVSNASIQSFSFSFIFVKDTTEL